LVSQPDNNDEVSEVKNQTENQKKIPLTSNYDQSKGKEIFFFC
jgi:hypothetical protein